MDVALIILACLCFLVGFAGCIVPGLPGPPLSYIGLLLIYWSGYADFSINFLVWWAVIALVVTLIDFYMPVWMTRKFGGSRLATIGSVVGLFAGLFMFPPVGMILCPFFGALIGQLLHEKNKSAKAFKVAFGSFAAFALGTGMKITACGVMLYYAIKALVA